MFEDQFLEPIDEADWRAWLKAILLGGSLLTIPQLLNVKWPSFREVKRLQRQIDLAPWILDKAREGEVFFLPLINQRVTVTAYSADPRETDSTPDEMSCGKQAHLVRRGLTLIALSRDLFFHPDLVRFFGKSKPLCGKPAYLRLESGEEIRAIIYDTMHPRFKNRVDIYMPTEKYGSVAKAKMAAKRFGVKEGELIVTWPIRLE